ncbi:exodeoxyribonuclease V subunit beta [Histophilus somni]|uniref:exodeoxyribonuclease V subunit beta n=1 Tax=Histophilus somni TaxID=731 RepID=UPI00094B69D9|nr:exodeoxyribonuclease V subunit beta [Histophilus somni]
MLNFMTSLQDQYSSLRISVFQPFNPISTPLSAVSLIEASAGTGKTHSIVSLYIRLLLQAGENNFSQALEVDQILVVTYTEMATQELKQRIRERVYQTKQALIQYQQHQNKTLLEDQFLQELLPYIKDIDLAVYRLTLAERNLDISAVSTIHSFCRRVLMQYAFNSGVHFNMELVSDESELIQRLANELWRENFYHQPLSVANFIFKKLGSPKQLVSYVYKYLSQPPKVNTQKPHLLEISLQQFLHTQVEPQLSKIHQFKQRWLENEKALRELVALKKWRKDWFESRFNKMRVWAENEDIQQPEAAKYFYQLELDKKEPLVSHDLFSELENLVTNEVTQISNNFSVLLYHCVHELNRKIMDYKLTHQQKGFDDLLRLVRNALYQPQGDKLAQLIRHQYPFAMIDEFQDTDQQQYDIFYQIYIKSAVKNTGFIMIGDPKQSIYKFRGADIFTYLKATEQAQYRFSLGENWRSTQPLIQTINYLFDFQENSPFLHKKIPFQQVAKGLYYDTQGNLLPNRFCLNGRIEPALRGYLTDNNDTQLAENCALSIEQWLQSAVQNQAILDNKPLKAKNIAVLVSSFTQAEKIQKALRDKGIASVYLSDRSNVFDSITAKELLHILRACLNPLNENNILNALSTALFAKTGAEIFQIKQDENLWENCVERFIAYQQQWQRQGILPMLHHLFAVEKINENLQMMEQGERKMTDLWHLSELLQQATRLNDTESSLVRWFEKQIQGEERLEEQIRLESDRELVKIVTLHKSKGLAYDLVWIPFICKPSLFRDNAINTYYDENQEQVLWDMDKQHSDEIEKERMAEDIRLLYVALTRAKYQIVINFPRIFEKKWNALLYVLTKGQIGANKRIDDEYDAKKLLSPIIEELGEQCVEIEEDKKLLVRRNEYITVQQALSPVEAEEFHGKIERNWTVTSFTEMTYRHQRNRSLNSRQKAQQIEISGVFDQARDHDVRENGHDMSASFDIKLSADSDYPVGFSPFDFPHGVHVGSEFHRYFEKYNMTQALNDDQLSKLCQTLQLSDEWQNPLKKWINAIFNTPLKQDIAGFTLGNIKSQDCLKEMQFYLKLNQSFNENVFNRLLSKYHHLPSSPILMDRIKGMVRGFIDLVVRFEGKYYLLDYKSNLLGYSSQHYQQDNLIQVMCNNHYDWQYLIYTIALHRYLKERDKNYDYQRDFGGVLYTFLRGMNGKDNSGIFFDKPDWRLISELESLF